MSPLSKQLLPCLSKKGVVFTIYHVQAATHFVAKHPPLGNSVGLSWQCQRKRSKKSYWKGALKDEEPLLTKKPQSLRGQAG